MSRPFIYRTGIMHEWRRKSQWDRIALAAIACLDFKNEREGSVSGYARELGMDRKVVRSVLHHLGLSFDEGTNYRPLVDFNGYFSGDGQQRDSNGTATGQQWDTQTADASTDSDESGTATGQQWDSNGTATGHPKEWDTLRDTHRDTLRDSNGTATGQQRDTQTADASTDSDESGTATGQQRDSNGTPQGTATGHPKGHLLKSTLKVTSNSSSEKEKKKSKPKKEKPKPSAEVLNRLAEFRAEYSRVKWTAADDELVTRKLMRAEAEAAGPADEMRIHAWRSWPDFMEATRAYVALCLEEKKLKKWIKEPGYWIFKDPDKDKFATDDTTAEHWRKHAPAGDIAPAVNQKAVEAAVLIAIAKSDFSPDGKQKLTTAKRRWEGSALVWICPNARARAAFNEALDLESVRQQFPVVTLEARNE